MSIEIRSHPTTYFSGTRSDELLRRDDVMRLIERSFEQWSDDDPPRFALSVLWGKIRDMEGRAK